MTRRIALAAAVLALLAGCATPAPTPPTAPTLPPPTTTAAPEPAAVPTIARWLNQPCSPEGATAKTTSGGDLICWRVGSETAPEWHVPSPYTTPKPVTAGAFCPTPGARGVTSAGKPMVCRTSPADSRDRWRTP